MAAVGALVYLPRPQQFAVRGMLAADLFGSSGSEFGELDLLYGRAVVGAFGHASLSTGLSATKPPGCPSGCSWIVGVPIVAEIAVRPAAVLGFGLQGFVNLNRHAAFGGIALLVQLGWLPR
jgi:hypothetical protein